MVLSLDGKVCTSNARFVDLNFGAVSYHGNYQGIRNLKDVVCYVIKDGEYKTNSEDWILLVTSEKKQRITDVIANRIISGQTLNALIAEYPGHLMMNLQRLQQFQAWYTRSQWTPCPLPAINFGMTPCESMISRWIALNLMDCCLRILRSPQLYLCGRPGTGKSTLISHLEKSYKTFKPSYSVQWWDGFDDTIELIVFDEFKGQIKCTFMNQILDGQTVIIPRRNGDFTKTKNIPVIICSNFAPCTIYNNNDSVEAFLGRLKLINIDEYFNIFK